MVGSIEPLRVVQAVYMCYEDLYRDAMGVIGSLASSSLVKKLSRARVDQA